MADASAEIIRATHRKSPLRPTLRPTALPTVWRMLAADVITARRNTHASGGLILAAVLTFGAAIIHLAVAPEHLRAYVPFGVFFLTVGCAQIIVAVELLAHPTRRLIGGLLLANLTLVGLWFISRRIGLPIGPTPWVPEETGLTDVICQIMQILAMLPLVALLVRAPRC